VRDGSGYDWVRGVVKVSKASVCVCGGGYFTAYSSEYRCLLDSFLFLRCFFFFSIILSLKLSRVPTIIFHGFIISKSNIILGRGGDQHGREPRASDCAGGLAAGVYLGAS